MYMFCLELSGYSECGYKIFEGGALMTDKQEKRNPDPEKVEQKDENEFNAGGNSSDYDGGHLENNQVDEDDRIKNGEEYARRQHGKDEIEDSTFNAGENASDYDGGHPNDDSSNTERTNGSDKN